MKIAIYSLPFKSPTEFKSDLKRIVTIQLGVVNIQILAWAGLARGKVFSEKATKFEKIFAVLLTRAYLSKSWRRFFKTNVVKSYYINFKSKTLLVVEIFFTFFNTALSQTSIGAQFTKQNMIKFSQQPCWMGAKFKFHYNYRILTWLGGAQVWPIGLHQIPHRCFLITQLFRLYDY
jgi:hypothetical protein